MKFIFDEIRIYCIKNEKLFLIPTGELKHFNVNVDIDPILVIDLPLTIEELKYNIKKCYDLCWSSTVEKLPEGLSQIEKALKVKSYKKVVEVCDNYSLFFYHDKKNYYFVKGTKHSNMRCYEGMEYGMTWNNIDYEFLLKEFQD